jgi:RNA polymerase-binding transcription factor DksA
LKELERIEADAAAGEEEREGSPFGKREEEADEVVELAKRLAMKKHLGELLVEIEHALEKYKSGTYGVCDRCGKTIEQGRLEALPQASLCLNCKSKQIRDSRGR